MNLMDLALGIHIGTCLSFCAWMWKNRRRSQKTAIFIPPQDQIRELVEDAYRKHAQTLNDTAPKQHSTWQL